VTSEERDPPKGTTPLPSGPGQPLIYLKQNFGPRRAHTPHTTSQPRPHHKSRELARRTTAEGKGARTPQSTHQTHRKSYETTNLAPNDPFSKTRHQKQRPQKKHKDTSTQKTRRRGTPKERKDLLKTSTSSEQIATTHKKRGRKASAPLLPRPPPCAGDNSNHGKKRSHRAQVFSQNQPTTQQTPPTPPHETTAHPKQPSRGKAPPHATRLKTGKKLHTP